MKLISQNMLVTIVFFVLFAVQSHAQKKEAIQTPETIQELQVAIEKIMEEEKIPAVGIALVNEAGPVWVTSLGKVNVEKDLDADKNSMFRIGSTSKMFTSLAILKMQEEGLLSLKDTVRNLVPEIEFTNQWEETNPILVEHLLEHTTGWDDFHVIEYAHHDTIPIKLKDGLDFHPQSRVSRWMPGTRMSYCNSGIGVAAYIVEKISGKMFENYVQENFFNPLGMELATYFNNDNFKKYGTATYIDGKAQPYMTILQRPAGAINASPTDMSKLLQFFINRGKIDSLQLISEESLKRMETCKTSIGAKAGLDVGYGLSNFSVPYKSFTFHTHGGSVGSALSEFGYLPTHNIGISVLVNSGNYLGFRRIVNLVLSYQTKNLKKEVINIDKVSSGENKSISGYYTITNPRPDNFYFMSRIQSIKQIWQVGDTIFIKDFFGDEVKKNIAVSTTQYISLKTGKIDVAQTVDPLDGEVVVYYKGAEADEKVLKPISSIFLFIQLSALVLWLILMLSSVVYGLIWPFMYWFGKINDGANIKVRMWPFVASLLIIATSILFISGASNYVEAFGKPGFISISFIITTIGFALTSIWSVVYVVKERNSEIGKIVYWYSAILAVLHLLITIYLLWFGVIGMRLWT